MKILPKSFYDRPTLKVAQDLLGSFLYAKSATSLRRCSARVCECAHANNNEATKVIKYKIVETEAYVGPNDLASHASRGRTKRNEVMFGEPGIIYVYFTYGMHYMLNIVTEKKGYPAAVLIRAVEQSCSAPPLRKTRDTNGPAKLTKTLGIDKKFNGKPIYTKKYGLWIEDRKEILKSSQVVKAKRIGIDYAGNYKEKLWRFYIKGNNFVSRK
ncbi:MAG: DNA-3-methyladenine glycosylase [Patescibacteria group bacterium]